jgi:phosphate transport system substrate-binding protein
MRNKTRLSAAAALAGILIGSANCALAQSSITLKGSDTMLQLGQAWSEAYHKSKNKVVTVTGGGSSTGIASLINGSCDVANASRPMKESEFDKAKARGFMPFETPVARDGLAVIVNPKNPITKLSVDQLKSIYEGSVKNWSQLGGASKAIVAVGRDSSSGTYGFFQDEVLKGGPYRSDMQTSPSTNAIAQTVSEDAGAIGYVGVAYAKAFSDKVKVLHISKGKGAAIEPTEDNVKKGTYPLWRYLYMYTRGKPGGAAKEFIDWVKSAPGQEVVEQVGYYRVK